jgi:DNA modification methylase
MVKSMKKPIATVLDQVHGEKWSAYHGDCVALASQIPDNSIDLSVYSPPFASLYIYSESEADMGNSKDDDEFLEQYRYLVVEKLRATRPGRLSCVHIKDMVYYQGSSEDGASGVRPLSDKITAAHLDAGWHLQCRVTIWRDPVLERSKTNAHGLLYKTFRGDASFCRVGMPEYLLVFRKWPRDEAEIAIQRPVIHERSAFPLPIWQELASPIWPGHAAACWNYAGSIGVRTDSDGVMRAESDGGKSGGGDLDLKATDTLNVRQAADPAAEKHLCPMPLNITSRAITLWSNAGDVVWSPFGGIGSEGVSALRLGRKFIMTELNPTYWRNAVGHLTTAAGEGVQSDLFGSL